MRDRGPGDGGTGRAGARPSDRCARPATRASSHDGPHTRRRGCRSPALGRCGLGRPWPCAVKTRTAAGSGPGPGSPTSRRGRWDDPGGARQPPRLGRGDEIAGGGLGQAEPGPEGVEVEGDQHRRRGTAVTRQPGGGDVLQQRAERLTPATREREPVDLGVEGDPTGRGVGIQVDTQPIRHVIGHPSEHVGHPVRAGSERQPGHRSRPLLLSQQRPLRVGVRDLRGDHLERVPAQPAQGDRVEMTRLGQQVGLRLAPQPRVEIIGQLVEDVDQDLRLLPVTPPRATPSATWVHRSRSAAPIRSSRIASRRDVRVSTASTDAADRAPHSSATSPLTASTSARRPATREAARVSAASSSVFSATDR